MFFFFSLSWLRVRIATGGESHGTALRFVGSISRMKWSMKGIPSRIFTAKSRVMPSHTRVRKCSMQRCGRLSLSNYIGCLVAVCSFGIISCFIRLLQLVCITEECIRFTPPPVSRGHMTVCITLISRPYVIRLLYVGLAVKTISDSVVGNGSGSNLRTV